MNSKYCSVCKDNTPHLVEPCNHVAHALGTAMTIGLWGFIWFSLQFRHAGIVKNATDVGERNVHKIIALILSVLMIGATYEISERRGTASKTYEIRKNGERIGFLRKRRSKLYPYEFESKGGNVNRSQFVKVILIILSLQFLMTDLDARPIWRGVAVHWTASSTYSKERCDYDHKARGWDECGYHFLIDTDGNIIPGRALDKIGAHVRGHNRQNIGIAFISQSEATSAQIREFVSLYKRLQKRFGKLYLLPHRAFRSARTDCPGPIWDQIKKKIRS